MAHDFCCFPQCFQTNSGILPRLRRDRFLPNPFFFICHPNIWRYIAYDSTANLVKNPSKKDIGERTQTLTRLHNSTLTSENEIRSLNDEIILCYAVSDVSGAYEYDCSNYWCPPGEECYMHYLYCFRGECKYTPRCKKKTTWSSPDYVTHCSTSYASHS